MTSLLELAQRIDQLAKVHNCSDVKIIQLALDRFDLFVKIGGSLFEREWLVAFIEACADGKTPFATYFRTIWEERPVVEHARMWRKCQHSGQPYDIGQLARAVDALLVDDPDFSEHDREHLKRLQSELANGIRPNRFGATTEYKRGEFYLSHTVWEDGHEEVEIHRCTPEQLFHSFDESEKGLPPPEQAVHTCDKNQFADVFARFAQIPAGPAQLLGEQEPSVHAQDHFRSLEE